MGGFISIILCSFFSICPDLTPTATSIPSFSPTSSAPIPTITPGVPTTPAPSAQPTGAVVSSSQFQLTYNGVSMPDVESRNSLTSIIGETMTIIFTGAAAAVPPFDTYQGTFLFCRNFVSDSQNNDTQISYVGNFVFGGEPVATQAEVDQIIGVIFRQPSIDNLFVGFNPVVVEALRSNTGNAYSATTSLGFQFV